MHSSGIIGLSLGSLTQPMPCHKLGGEAVNKSSLGLLASDTVEMSIMVG